MSSELELLRFFRILMKTRSLTQTADRLNISQSSASRSLERLRTLFKDPLFVRSGYGMVPTSYAESLTPQVSDALQRLEDLFSKSAFSPGNITRDFHVGAVDNGVFMVLPHIFKAFFSQAPKATLNILPAHGDLYKQLEEGYMDLAIYPKSSPPPDFHQALLFRSENIYIVRKDHPLARYASEGQLAPAKEAHRYPHLVINSYALPKIDFIGVNFDDVKSRAPLRVPYFLAAAAVLEHTEFILSLPRPTAEFMCRRAPLVTVQTDPPQRKFHTRIIWHHRVHHDPAVTWLRGLFIDSAKK